MMVNVTQGTLRNLRDDLFSHMEKLPIQYFDTHAHGDIMSVYTNDIDTLRQMISQSIPQVLNSAVTIVQRFCQHADPEYSADHYNAYHGYDHGDCDQESGRSFRQIFFVKQQKDAW